MKMIFLALNLILYRLSPLSVVRPGFGHPQLRIWVYHIVVRLSRSFQVNCIQWTDSDCSCALDLTVPILGK